MKRKKGVKLHLKYLPCLKERKRKRIHFLINNNYSEAHRRNSLWTSWVLIWSKRGRTSMCHFKCQRQQHLTLTSSQLRHLLGTMVEIQFKVVFGIDCTETTFFLLFFLTSQNQSERKRREIRKYRGCSTKIPWKYKAVSATTCHYLWSVATILNLWTSVMYLVALYCKFQKSIYCLIYPSIFP